MYCKLQSPLVNPEQLIKNKYNYGTLHFSRKDRSIARLSLLHIILKWRQLHWWM